MWRPLTRTSSRLDDPAAGTPSTRSREAREPTGPLTCPKLWHSLTSANLGMRKRTQRKARTIQRKKRRLKLKTPKLKWSRIIPGLSSFQLTVRNQERNSRKVFLLRLVTSERGRLRA